MTGLGPERLPPQLRQPKVQCPTDKPDLPFLASFLRIIRDPLILGGKPASISVKMTTPNNGKSHDQIHFSAKKIKHFRCSKSSKREIIILIMTKRGSHSEQAKQQRASGKPGFDSSFVDDPFASLFGCRF